MRKNSKKYWTFPEKKKKKNHLGIKYKNCIDKSYESCNKVKQY